MSGLRPFTICALAFAGCSCRVALGPRLLPRDRAQYSVSLSESWKEQTLLNIVKLRYIDPPIFIDISSIVASYSLQQNVSVGGTITANGTNSGVIGGSGTFSNSPTITYVPLTGSKFITSLMTPLPPASVFASIQAGQPADATLLASLASINGLKNQEASTSGLTPADPDFYRVIALARRIQRSGAVMMYVKQSANKETSSLLALRTQNVPPEVLADILEFRRILGLSPTASEFNIVYGAVPANDTEVAVLTRSIIGLMKTMAVQVEVPPEHARKMWAVPGFETGRDVPGVQRLIRIHSGKDKPENEFVSVNYHNAWFWIDDGDIPSKQIFSMMMTLFTMADTGQRDNLPLVTIPAH